MSRQDTDFTILITTCSSEDEAERIAHLLVKNRLAACAQISGPITSYYWWQGNFEQDKEWQIKFKMPSANFDQACKLIKENHSYEVPQIISVKIDRILSEYAAWLMSETRLENP